VTGGGGYWYNPDRWPLRRERDREVAGWLLVALGLLTFGTAAYVLLKYRWILEAPPMAFMGFIVFRGGIHLLKVAVAARLLQQASAQMEAARKPKPAPSRPLAPILARRESAGA
jgi:hypothetical protein